MEGTFMPAAANGSGRAPVSEDDDDMDIASNDGDESDNAPPLPPSLIIPITSSERAKKENLFIEIFPEEMSSTPSSTLMQVLRDEDAPLSVWADAAMHYMQQSNYRQHSRDASVLFQAACDLTNGSNDDRLRVLASAGIAYLAQAQQSASATSDDMPDANQPNAELRSLGDVRLNVASKISLSSPMVWIGRAMFGQSTGRPDQARFFFKTTLQEVQKTHGIVVLPALLGMAAILYSEKNYQEAQEMYMKAIRLYPEKSGAPARVGFGLTCYKLGQIDRARAAFARALAIDNDNVDALVGVAILDMACLDETSKDFKELMERAIKMMSKAHMIDPSNAMVQNHLADHYFWTWTPLPGLVEMTKDSNLVKGTQPIPLDPGERVRIGTDFETYVAEDVPGEGADGDDTTTIRIQKPWKKDSIKGLKIWKKDYDRVEDLAKGAYRSTSVQEIQAESKFLLARVYHAQGMFEKAHESYEIACRLAPNLSPARFGLAQTLVAQGEHEQAIAHLQLVLGTSATATDALATLGLLEVKSKKAAKVQEGISYLRKAIDLDPLNPELILLEALALQQQESNYTKSLERYKKAVQLMERQGRKVSYEIYANIGVLCHETKNMKESLDMYCHALDALDEDGHARVPTLDNIGKEGGYLRDKDNFMFAGYVSTELKVERPSSTPEGETTLKILESVGKEQSSIPLRVNDYIKLGEAFETQISEIVSLDDGHLAIKIKDAFKNAKKPDDDAKSKDDIGDDGENKDTQKDKEIGEAAKEPTSGNDDNKEDSKSPIIILVKRENKRLENASAISIAFNLARLHEVDGRTLAAVELHKAIIKRNPAYVNSYLRLACIAIDCAALKECAAWLKIAAETAPGNPEVLTLIGNLHLSLCDWAPAQQVFDGLLARKVPNVEAYSMLSLGNIYFANLKTAPKRYGKHLQYSADYYKRILSKDKANAYAANGLGTVLAEKGELFKAKDVFLRVREVSGDTIPDAHLNLGHIYLAQKKHPEALQMYQSYMKRTEDGTAPISSKSRVDDMVDVLLYISFAYFDWARQTELFNNTKAAPADERYKKAMEYLQQAIEKNTSKRVLLTYNLCMTKLQAANCVLQKMTRNIRRTAKEVEDALDGLEESLTTVEEILRGKTEQKLKVPIATSILNDFLSHCRNNIESAKSHLEDERRREAEANEIRQLQILAAEEKRKQHELEKQRHKQEETRKQEDRDKRARAKMRQVEDLRAGWEQAKAAEQAAANKKKKNQTGAAPDAEIDGLFAEQEQDNTMRPSQGLFDDSDDSDNDETPAPKNTDKDKTTTETTTQEDLFGDSEDDDSGKESDEELVPSTTERSKKRTEDDDSDKESDEELMPSTTATNKKRESGLVDSDDEDEQPAKKQKILEDSD